MGTYQSRTLPTTKTASWETSFAFSSSCRFSIRQDDGKKRMRPRVAERRKGTRTKQGDVYGFDGGKKVKGRKRHLIVDSLGQIMKVIVTEANGGERVGAAYGLMEWREQYPEIVERLKTVLADAGYRGDKFRLCVWLLV